MNLRRVYFVIRHVESGMCVLMIDNKPVRVTYPEQSTLYEDINDAFEDVMYFDESEYVIEEIAISVTLYT